LSSRKKEYPVSELKLAATTRSEFGKGAARRLRRAHQIPAVIYGHGTAPVHIALPEHAPFMALKKANVLLTIELEGKKQLALPKDVQRDPIRDIIEHVDLILVRSGEKVTVDVPVHVVGEPQPGTVVSSEANTLSLEVEATHIPTFVEVDIAGFAGGTVVLAGQIVLPKGATLIGDAEAIIVRVAGLAAASEDDAAADAAE
jgi:large subunit ribosomal protein L25